MQVLCRLDEAHLLGNRSRVYHEDNAADIGGVRELRRGEVAQFSVAGGVNQEEAARALVCRVAGGAIVRRAGRVAVREKGLNGEGSGGCVSLSDGFALGLAIHVSPAHSSSIAIGSVIE